jgi:hypothetical protein
MLDAAMRADVRNDPVPSLGELEQTFPIFFQASDSLSTRPCQTTDTGECCLGRADPLVLPCAIWPRPIVTLLSITERARRINERLTGPKPGRAPEPLVRAILVAYARFTLAVGRL